MPTSSPTPLVAGIILAAGQSKRMQWPTALLPLPDGRTLLEVQVDLLGSAGCASVIVVTGAHTTLTRERLPALKVTWGHNARWQGGVFVSLQIGLSLALTSGAVGCIVLPIDVIGVSVSTFTTILREGRSASQPAAVVPTCTGKWSSLVYLSRSVMERLATQSTAAPEARLSDQLKVTSGVVRIAVDDPRVALNVNTQQEWRVYLDSLESGS